MNMETLNRDTTPIRMRNYGRILQEMIFVAAQEQDEETRHNMTVYIARCMRNKNLAWNKDQDSSMKRIMDDILTLSDGRLSCDFPEFELFFSMNNNVPSRLSRRRK